MATKIQNLATNSLTEIIQHKYREALAPLIDALDEQMNTNLKDKKHILICTKEDTNLSPIVPFVQAVLSFHYKVGASVEWTHWSKNGRKGDEPERYGRPNETRVSLVIEGLSGGTINISRNYAIQEYHPTTAGDPNVYKAVHTGSLCDWGLNLGGRHYELVEKYLKGLTLDVLKGKTVLELTEPTP